jgi:hypothetical protein
MVFDSSSEFGKRTAALAEEKTGGNNLIRILGVYYPWGETICLRKFKCGIGNFIQKISVNVSIPVCDNNPFCITLVKDFIDVIHKKPLEG